MSLHFGFEWLFPEKEFISGHGEDFLGKNSCFGGFLVISDFWVSKLYGRFEEDESVLSNLGHDIRSCVALC